ncbi:MAG: FtsX-like permease family protein, partial [Planctomycetes bacterium]|nr:FtsX-like permease family protein [Planctomycetota bacterium]
RAMGAKRSDIVYQFLAETAVLSGFGGFLGIGFGLLSHPKFRAVEAVHWVIKSYDRIYKTDVWSSIPPTIQALEPRLAYWSVGLSFGISVCVGIVFGLYPAVRASRMDPIEALRHE